MNANSNSNINIDSSASFDAYLEALQMVNHQEVKQQVESKEQYLVSSRFSSALSM